DERVLGQFVRRQGDGDLARLVLLEERATLRAVVGGLGVLEAALPAVNVAHVSTYVPGERLARDSVGEGFLTPPRAAGPSSRGCPRACPRRRAFPPSSGGRCVRRAGCRGGRAAAGAGRRSRPLRARAPRSAP